MKFKSVMDEFKDVKKMRLRHGLLDETNDYLTLFWITKYGKLSCTVLTYECLTHGYFCGICNNVNNTASICYSCHEPYAEYIRSLNINIEEQKSYVLQYYLNTESNPLYAIMHSHIMNIFMFDDDDDEYDDDLFDEAVAIFGHL